MGLSIEIKSGDRRGERFRPDARRRYGPRLGRFLIPTFLSFLRSFLLPSYFTLLIFPRGYGG